MIVPLEPEHKSNKSPKYNLQVEIAKMLKFGKQKYGDMATGEDPEQS